MNIFIYGILLIFSVNLSKENIITLKNDKINMIQRSVGSDIKDLLEEFRYRMCHEIPNKGIPKLDPFGLEEDFKLSIEEEMAQLDIEISNFSASGLHKFDFPKLKFIINKIDLELVLPKMKLKTNYKVNGTITDLFDLKGDGDISLEADNIKLILVARFLLINNVFSFKVDKLEPSIEKINFRINNLFPDKELDDFVSDMVSDIGIDMFNDLWLQYEEDVKELISLLGSGLIEGLTLKDLLEMIGNLGEFFDENDPKPDCKFDDFLKVPQLLLLK